MLFEPGFLWAPASLNFNTCDYFLWRYLVDRVFQKNQYTIPELKTAIQSEIEATPIETLTMAHTIVFNKREVKEILTCQMIKKYHV
jgi:hypothetical protein